MLKKFRRHNAGFGIALGIGVGVAIGVAMHNIGVGIAIGIAIGVAFESSLRKKRRGPTGKDGADGKAN